jgi:hypothetical protein
VVSSRRSATSSSTLVEDVGSSPRAATLLRATRSVSDLPSTRRGAGASAMGSPHTATVRT